MPDTAQPGEAATAGNTRAMAVPYLSVMRNSDDCPSMVQLATSARGAPSGPFSGSSTYMSRRRFTSRRTLFQWTPPLSRISIEAHLNSSVCASDML